MNEARHVVGCMTGSSLDALDVALVRIVGRGLEMSAAVESFGSHPLDSLSGELRRLIAGESVPMRTSVQLADALGRVHAEAIASHLNGRRADFIAVHGQTVVHAPPIGHQLINPWPIAHRFGIPVVCGMRDADLALGGQGAPITPIADLILFRHQTQSRAVVNLGGFCNISRLPACQDARAGLGSVRGFDVCPCNHWLDHAARERLGEACDLGGAAASRGRVDDSYCQMLSARLEQLSGEGRSFGPGDDALPMPASLSPEDTLASIVHAIAGRIARETAGVDAVLLAGGSAANSTLVSAIGDACAAPVSDTASVGIMPAAREAVAMAVLGALCHDGVAVCLPQITGAEGSAVAGSWVFPHGMNGAIHD